MSARQYWSVLREDRGLILAVVLAAVVIAGAVGVLLPREYTSTATFYVASPQATTSSTESYQGAQLSSERVKSYSELLTGPRVAADASALLGGSPTPLEVQDAVSADSVSETVVLDLEVTEPTPAEARTVAAAVTTAFTRLVGNLESTGQPVNRPIVTTEVILPASLPTEPAGPSRVLLLGAGLLVGLVVGVGAALVRRAMRRAVDTEEVFAELVGGPLLGRIPWTRRAPRVPALLDDPAPGGSGRRARAARARSESIRRLRTAVRSVAGRRGSLVLIGSGPGQGTSTTALELAAAFSAGGERVLLVDADLRRPSLAARLGLDDDLGLADVLLGSVTPDVAVQRWDDGGFDVLTAGSPVAHPNEVLARSGPVLARLASSYRRVVVDTPSASGAADGVDLARVVDGVLVVGRRGRAAPDEVLRAASALRLVGARVLGSVFTDAAAVADAPVESRRGPLALPPVLDQAPTAITGPIPIQDLREAAGTTPAGPTPAGPEEDVPGEDPRTVEHRLPDGPARGQPSAPDRPVLEDTAALPTPPAPDQEEPARPATSTAATTTPVAGPATAKPATATAPAAKPAAATAPATTAAGRSGTGSSGRSATGKGSTGKGSTGKGSTGRDSTGKGSTGKGSTGKGTIGRSSNGRSSNGRGPKATRTPSTAPDGAPAGSDPAREGSED